MPTGEEVFGELTLAGRKTNLHLRHPEQFANGVCQTSFIIGKLYDLTAVSLVNCIIPPFKGFTARGEETIIFTDIFPHLVLEGSVFLEPKEDSITGLRLVVSDAEWIFYENGTFGVVTKDNEPLVRSILDKRPCCKHLEVGEGAQVLYFAGGHRITSVDTSIGTLVATNNTTTNSGDAEGVCIQNTIEITLDFASPINLLDSIARSRQLLMFIAIVAGRPQSIVEQKIKLTSKGGQPNFLTVHWSMPLLGSGDAPDETRLDPLLDATNQAARRVQKSLCVLVRQGSGVGR